MNISESISACYSKYFTFKGRASRSEYWWFTLYAAVLSLLINALVSAVFGQPAIIIDPDTGMPSYTLVYWYGLLVNLFISTIPSISAMVRRLHDTGRSGWWWLINFTIIGIIFFIYWLAKPGDEDKNNYNI